MERACVRSIRARGGAAGHENMGAVGVWKASLPWWPVSRGFCVVRMEGGSHNFVTVTGENATACAYVMPVETTRPSNGLSGATASSEAIVSFFSHKVSAR